MHRLKDGEERAMKEKIGFMGLGAMGLPLCKKELWRFPAMDFV
jgi:hypothetical protein